MEMKGVHLQGGHSNPLLQSMPLYPRLGVAMQTTQPVGCDVFVMGEGHPTCFELDDI